MATITDNQFKLTYAIRTLLVYLFCAIMAGRITINTLICIGIFCAYQFWNITWIKLLATTECLYSVRVPTTIIPDWIQFSLPSGKELKIRKNKVVTSISELSGIRGMHLMIALRIMTALICALLIVAIHTDLNYRQTNLLNIRSTRDFVPILLYFMIVGFFCVGHFELNLMDSFHTSWHFFGVTFIFIGSLSCGFLLNWNLYSIVLTVLHFGLAVYWTNLTETVPKTSNDIKEVTRISKLCVGVELFMFQVTNVMLLSTVYALGENEGNMFASPWRK